MKKIVSSLLICLLIVGLSVSAFAAGETFTFAVSAQGEYADSHNIVAEAGATITVEYRLTVDATRGANAVTQNEINYDGAFFTFVDGSISLTDNYGSGMSCSNKQRLNGEQFVFFNNASSKGFSDGMGENPSVIGTFQLMVNPNATGSSVINSRNYGAKTLQNEACGAKAVDLKVTVAGTQATTPVTGVTLNKAFTTIKAGEKETLTATVTPADATNARVRWSSNKENIATVDANGVVTAVADGMATITATTEDGGKTASCTVIVGEEMTAVTGVTLNKTATTLKAGTSEMLTATVQPLNATDQNVTWSSSNHAVATVGATGKVTAKAPGTAIITVTTAEGGKTATCTVTVEQNEAATSDGMTTGGEQTAAPVTQDGTATKNPFTDVQSGSYYYNAVLWAAEKNITTGTDATHFSPDAPVTRAQVVTFLWRAAGSPAPAANASQFTDVKAGGYYEKAVAWAVSKGITKGTSDTTFGPDAVCTRGQIVTFLARYAGVQDTQTASAFNDVKATDYFAAAVQWAKDNNVTSGTSATTFSPKQNCTRAQVVTFLYRWMVR